MTLLEALLNRELIVVAIDSKVASRLAAMGIVIGCELMARQRKPAVIIEYAETLLAFDAEVAAQVHVDLVYDKAQNT